MYDRDEIEHKLELQIQRELVEFLRGKGWLVQPMWVDSYQNGIPDLYCFHKQWGPRWVEVKRPKGYSFTHRQRQKFPAWETAGIGIWILNATTQDQYDLLFGPPNWRSYWRDSMALPDRAAVDAMIDTLAQEHQQSQAAEQKN